MTQIQFWKIKWEIFPFSTLSLLPPVGAALCPQGAKAANKPVGAAQGRENPRQSFDNTLTDSPSSSTCTSPCSSSSRVPVPTWMGIAVIVDMVPFSVS